MPIACALDGAEAFATTCLVEVDGARLVVREPDGGFRRFGFDGGGSLYPVDGIDAFALARAEDGSTEIAVDGDRYRIPAELMP